jgi:hypothetical protein
MTFEALRSQLGDAAAAFANGPGALAGILSGLVDDVDRALREELEIFPVCHHSPASGLAMVRRLREKQPKVIYLELCEDLQPLLTELRNCQLPVAVQAFASTLDGFPSDWGPLSVVAPITESSAEYQAIAYALETPGVELVCVDRSSDHVFQWLPQEDAKPVAADSLHGDAVGIDVGDLRPGFAELEAYLLHHGKVRHWSEWWDQYVEQPLAGAGYETYRQAMVLIGSLFRRLGTDDPARLARDEDRERYMWTRMRAHMASSGAAVGDCLYVCGAFHAASHVSQFGAASAEPFEITPRTRTKWLYGLIPSSYAAIESQFSLAPGSVSIAAATWSKALSRNKLSPFRLEGQKGTTTARAKKALAAPVAPVEVTDQLTGFLSQPPTLDSLDEAELLGWCVDIVRLARRNGYLASTADAIAIYETSILLAGMRNRARPTPYDFMDAAVTCIEKDAVPGRRDVARLCEILMGGDRIGQVGYDSLPPLARDVYDRLAPLGLKLEQRTVQRALLDLQGNPGLVPASRLLWMLRYLMPQGSVRAIMGSRELGVQSIQESWDLSIGKHQRSLIELGYEGVTIEQVLEQRLRRAVWDPSATAATALAAVEDSLLYLGSRRFTDELGQRAVTLLAAERAADDAPQVLKRIRRLLAYYRTSAPAIPAWCESFVKTGYAHYCTLLPTAFVEEETGVRAVAAMLGFLSTMESLALSLGCDRAQLEIAVRQSHPEAPAKVALLWAVRHQLGMLTLGELRQRAHELLANPLVVPKFPLYLSGFIQALEPVPSLNSFVVELLSTAFARIPDPVLLPWMPTLIKTLREEAAELMPMLVREAGRTFPAGLSVVDSFVPPWSARRPALARAVAHASSNALPLLHAHSAATNALAGLLDITTDWATPPDASSSSHSDTNAGSRFTIGVTAEPPAAKSLASKDLVAQHPQPADALHALLTSA